MVLLLSSEPVPDASMSIWTTAQGCPPKSSTRINLQRTDPFMSCMSSLKSRFKEFAGTVQVSPTAISPAG